MVKYGKILKSIYYADCRYNIKTTRVIIQNRIH